MEIMLLLVVPAIVVALLGAPLVPFFRGISETSQMKKAMRRNLTTFAAVCIVAVAVPAALAAGAPAAETAAAGAAVASSATGLGYIAAALVTGLAAIGAGIAVAAAAPAAIGAFSEDPKSFGKSLIFVALGEGVAIYGLLISILILNKI